MERPAFSIIGCQHGHLIKLMDDLLGMGYRCAGIYEEAGEDMMLARMLANRYDVPLLGHIAEALTDDVRLVGCAAVNSRKIGIAELCEERGKAIMFDKPAVTCRDGLDRLGGIVGRGRIEVGMLLTQRFGPAAYTLKQLLDEGALGRLLSLGIRKPHRLSADGRPRWFFDRELSGGIIQDLLVHDLDLLRWLTNGEIADCQGYLVKRTMPEHPRFYDVAQLNVRMESGAIAQLYADWHTPERHWTWGDGRIFAVGTAGTAELRLQGDPLIARGAMLLMSEPSGELRSVPLRQPPVGVTGDFLNRLEGRPSALTGADIWAASRAALEADERAERICCV